MFRYHLIQIVLRVTQQFQLQHQRLQQRLHLRIVTGKQTPSDIFTEVPGDNTDVEATSVNPVPLPSQFDIT